MKRPIDRPLPLPDAPPFWAPITDAERPLYGSLTPADRLAEANGFAAARFLISHQQDRARSTVVGYVRGALGIYSARVGGAVVATIVHIPTGVGLVQALGDDTAFFVADVIRTLHPWEAIATVDQLTQAGPSVIERIESVGCNLRRMPFRGDLLPIWMHAHSATPRRAS